MWCQHKMFSNKSNNSPTGLADGTLKHEDLCTTSNLSEIQCKLTFCEREHQSHRTSQLCHQYWMKRTYADKYATTGEPENWTKFAKTHVIRHSYSLWSGIAVVLIIDQVHVCSLKSIGGLSHGRKWSKAQQFSWLLSKPTCAEYNQPSETQKLTSVSSLSSD